MTKSLIIIFISLFVSTPVFLQTFVGNTDTNTPYQYSLKTQTLQYCSTAVSCNQSVNNHFVFICVSTSGLNLFLQTFIGNTDGNTPVTNIFQQPFQARYIRIRPTAWNTYTDLRIELLGCRGIVSINHHFFKRQIVHNLTKRIGVLFV